MLSDKILENLPEVKKDIAKKYLRFSDSIRKTTKQVIGRDLDDEENSRIRLLAFEISIESQANEYLENYGLKDLDKSEAIKIISRLINDDFEINA